jgi:hypothetical protein
MLRNIQLYVNRSNRENASPRARTHLEWVHCRFELTPSMARKSAKAPPAKPTPAVATTLALSDLRIRLEFLEQDNQKLIAKIEKKRTELTNLVDRIRDMAAEVSQRSAPLLQQMLELDAKMHAAFAEIFNGRKLGKQTRKQVENVYANLQASGLISPYREPAEELGEGKDRSNDDDNPMDEDDDWGWNGQQFPSNFEEESPKLDRDELKKIRQLFLRLAEVFHPDKVNDPEVEKYHTEVMKEINQAYQSGDLAKLLAIEKKHQMGEIIDRDNEDDLTRRCARIEQENEFLKSQFENLKSELRLNKNTPQGAMLSEYRKLSKAGYDPIGELVEQTEMQVQAIAEVYAFVIDFRDKRITIKDFMKGPDSFQQMQEMSDEELFFEMLGL